MKSEIEASFPLFLIKREDEYVFPRIKAEISTRGSKKMTDD